MNINCTKQKHPEKGWNGEFKGVLQPIGTYVWIFEGKDAEGNTIRSRGASMLIK